MKHRVPAKSFGTPDDLLGKQDNLMKVGCLVAAFLKQSKQRKNLDMCVGN